MTASRWVPAFAAVLVGATIAVAGGVTPLDVTIFALYHAVFVLVPGLVLARAVFGLNGARALVTGWALGMVLEVAMYATAQAAGIFGLFLVYPLAVPALCALAGRTGWRLAARWPGRRAADEQEVTTGRAWPWLVVGIYAIALVYLAVGLFPTTPTPGSGDVAYYPDYVFDIALSADALHHWPVGAPWLGGAPYHYQWLTFFHAAATARTTGLPLALLFGRLLPVAQLGFLTLGLAVAGRTLFRSARAGLLAAAIVLLVGELEVSSIASPFLGVFREDLYLSPTFLDGLVLFVAILPALGEVVRAERTTWRDVCLLGILLAGAAAAKGAVLPVLLGGLGLVAVWRLARDRQLPTRLMTVGSGVFAVFVATFAAMYAGGDVGLRAGTFTWAKSTFLVQKVSEASGGPILTAAVAAAYGLLYVLPYALAFVPPVGGWRGVPEAALLLGTGVAAILLVSFTDQPGVSQLYFMFYGQVALALVAAACLDRALSAAPRWLAAVVPGLTVGVLGALGVALRRGALPPSLGRSDVAHVVVPLAAGGGLVVLTMCIARWRTPGTWRTVAAFGGLVVVAFGALDAPFDLAPSARAIVEGRELAGRVDTQRHRGLTVELADALEWVKQHTAPDDTVAVANHYIDPVTFDSRYVYAAAFSERRVFIEGWGYTPERYKRSDEQIASGDIPFRSRVAVNDRAFTGDARALADLGAEGVDYLVADLRQSDVHTELDLPIVYENAGAIVFALKHELAGGG